MSEDEYFARTTPEQRLEHRKRYLRTHAALIVCPPCRNEKRPLPMKIHIAQCVCICPKCEKIWIYKTQIERDVIKRKPYWKYSKNQIRNVI